MINLWPLLLPAAAWSGWWIAHKNSSSSFSKKNNQLSREYVVGLNFLLNEQPDKALDVFIKLLEVDSDTVETHLALGSLFRRRGEVDRAIRIHQNLIARPQLKLTERKEALMALGQDYMSAGLFDRAEKIFLEVLELGGYKETASLQGLLAIYEQEKSWDNALDIIRKLEMSTGVNMNAQAAHYYCEIAMQALEDKAFEKAQNAIKQAQYTDTLSVRASLMQAAVDIQFHRYRQAIVALRTAIEQDPEFTCEAIAPLMHCHEALNTMDECIQFLKGSIEKNPRTSIIFVVADYIKKTRGLDVAIDFVAEKLKSYPSIHGLNRLIDWHLETAHGKVKEKLEVLYKITSRFLDNKPIYRCKQCGFGGKHLHWHCPSCKQWGKMKPVHGLEGD